MRSALRLAALIGALAVPSLPAYAIDPGTAQGTMTADGITVPLTHAYALVYGNEEGMLEGPEMRVLLTDRDVPIAVLSGPILDRLDGMARKGEVRGLVLRLDLQQLAKGPINGTVLLAPADPEMSLTFLTLSGGEGIESLQVTDTRVSGKVAFSVAGDTPAESATAQATFGAPKFRDEISTRMNGAEAAGSPPAQVLARWNDALRKGDFEQLRSLSGDDKYHELEAFRAEVGNDGFRKVASEVPSGDEVRRQIKEVIIRGNRAFIIIDDDEERNVATATRIGDRWVVD